MILEWTINGQTQSHWLSPGARVTIGRGADCTITLANPTVSRHHAEVYANGPAFYLRNASQTNTITVEHYGQTVQLGYGQESILPAGGRIRFGQVEVEIREAAILRVRCPGPCGKVVAVPASGFCPNCGTALATAETFTG